MARAAMRDGNGTAGTAQTVSAGLASSSELTELATLLRCRDSSGLRTVVPVFGSGVNIQAAVIDGSSRLDGWADMLARISAATGSGTSLGALPSSPLAVWEQLLCQWATRDRLFTFEAERALQRFVADDLRREEREYGHFSLYRSIMAARFADVISLNFDRRIALAAPKCRFQAGPQPSPHGPAGESLFRHCVAHHAEGGVTRVWFPHGDVKKATTIKFGIRTYGFYLGVLEEHLRRKGGSWRYRPTPWQRENLRQASPHHPDTPSWIRPFLTRPVVFIGCSLCPDEWALWSMLRHRLMARRAPPAFYVAFGSFVRPAHFSVGAIRPIVFADADRMWAFLLESFVNETAS